MSAKNTPLKNAEKIIDRFGGIRPMASKIDVPVTTVQGWKKRDAIPATRRQLILEAAKVNNIDLSDLVDHMAESTSASGFGVKSSQAQPARSEKADIPDVLKATEIGSTEFEDIEGMQNSKDLMAEIEASEKKAVRNSIWGSAALMAIVIAGGAILLWPDAKEVQSNIQAQGQQIEGLETEVAQLDEDVKDVNARSKFLTGLVPEDLQDQFQGFKNQAENLQNTFTQIDEKTKDLREGVFSADAGSIADRVSALENQVSEFTQGNGFAGLIDRVKTLEASLAGQEQLKLAMEELQTILDNMDGRVASVDQRLSDAQSGDSPLGQTLEGVSGNDLKAAAMLIAFSQMRDSLNREEPFLNDIVLLKRMAGEDNPELIDALDRLAPHADGGVLSAEGLSNEFKGLAGDIVFSSLSGDDVSISDKAKARLSDVLTIEKDGEVISGTDTQAAVSRAQALLDEGDVTAALAILQELEGPAAETAQPFIQQAEVSMLANQVQTMLRESILSKVSSMPSSIRMPQIAPAGAGISGSGTMDLNQITDTIKQVIPQSQVIKDEESGVVILERNQKFKGLSSGQ